MIRVKVGFSVELSRLLPVVCMHSALSGFGSRGFGFVEKPFPYEVNDGTGAQHHKMNKIGDVKACYIPVLLLGLQLTPRTLLGEIGPG